MYDALAEVGNPRKCLMEIYKTMGELLEQLEDMLGAMGSGDEKRIEGGEGLKGDDEEVATETNPLDIASLTDHDEDLIGAKLLPDDVDHGDSGSIDIAGLQREPR